MSRCPHGFAGACPDCPPFVHVVGELRGPRHARAYGHICRRTRPDGSLDWVTSHLTKWGARRAARRYMRDGTVKGWRP